MLVIEALVDSASAYFMGPSGVVKDASYMCVWPATRQLFMTVKSNIAPTTEATGRRIQCMLWNWSHPRDLISHGKSHNISMSRKSLDGVLAQIWYFSKDNPATIYIYLLMYLIRSTKHMNTVIKRVQLYLTLYRTATSFVTHFVTMPNKDFCTRALRGAGL